MKPKPDILVLFKPKRELTGILLTWLCETFPQHTKSFNYYSSHPYGEDEINLVGYPLFYVGEEKVFFSVRFNSAGELIKGTLDPHDPKFFIKLKAEVVSRLKEISSELL